MMTPITLILDRNFRGVGRVKLRTGTTLPAVRKKMNGMLDDVLNQGRLDVLRALRDRKIWLMELLDLWQRKALDQVPTGETAQLLAPAMKRWIAAAQVSESHRRSLRVSLRTFQREKANALVADLPMLLDRLRETRRVAHPRSFNLCRSAASAFVRATLKRSHPLYLAVLAVEGVSNAPQNQHHPLTVGRNAAVFPESRHGRAGRHRVDVSDDGHGRRQAMGRVVGPRGPRTHRWHQKGRQDQGCTFGVHAGGAHNAATNVREATRRQNEWPGTPL